MGVFSSIFKSLFIPQLWTPNNIKTLAWHDASDLNTIIGSPTVTQWNDKSGNNNNFIVSGNPQTGARIQNNLNVMDLEPIDSFAKFGFNIPASGDIAFYVVSEIDIIDNLVDSILSYNSNGADFQFQANHATQFDGAILVSGIGNDDVVLAGGPFPGPSIYNVVFNFGTGIEAFIDGILKGSSAGYITKLANTGGQQYQLFVNRQLNSFPAGMIAEAIVTEDVTTNTRELMEGYLAWKWGLQGSLPAGHPYKDAAPTI